MGKSALCYAPHSSSFTPQLLFGLRKHSTVIFTMTTIIFICG